MAGGTVGTALCRIVCENPGGIPRSLISVFGLNATDNSFRGLPGNSGNFMSQTKRINNITLPFILIGEYLSLDTSVS